MAEGTRVRRRRRWWLLPLAVVVVWAAAASLLVLRAKGHAEDGLETIEDVAPLATRSLPRLVDSLSDPTSVDSDTPVPELLRDAAEDFARARDELRSPVLAPLLAMPVAGRQLRSARALATSATVVGDAAAVAFDELTGLLDTASGDPATRLEAGRDAEAVLRRLQDRIADLDLGPDEALIGRLASARHRFTREYDRVTSTLGLAVDAIGGLNSFLAGPTRYLLLAANNAEMRAGSGMFLQVGVLEVVEGRFEVTDLQPTRDLVLEAPGAALDPDVAANWGPLLPAQEWRNVNLTPRFDESARMATEMWASLGEPVQGAISVDIAGLRTLLELVGAVEVDGRQISADDVQRYLLLEQYREFEGQEVEARDDQLEEVARATLEAFSEREVAPGDLLSALQTAGARRHIMLWSSDQEQQRAWESVDAAGLVPEDALMLSVLNRGGNKLDQFLDVKAQLETSEVADGVTAAVTVTIANNTPTSGLPTYIQGPYPGLGVAAGTYVGIVQLTVPGAAGNFVISGGAPAVNGPDGDAYALATEVRVERGASTFVRFEFALPRGLEELRGLASARLPGTEWTSTHEERPWRDGAPRTVVVE